MNRLLENTTNHRRAIMFISTMLLGIFMVLVFYQFPLTFREFLVPPIVGLLIFEFLFRTRQYLRPATLPLYFVIVCIGGELSYGLLYAVSFGGGGWSPIASMSYLFLGFPENLPTLFEYLIVIALAYYLIKIYRNETWVIAEMPAEPGTMPVEAGTASTFAGWLQEHTQQIAGFIGWYLLATVLSSGGAYGLITTPATLICLLVFARSKQSKGVAGGILIAVALNFAVALVRGLSLNGFCFVPFYVDYQ